jgi:hypothetical protein
MVNSDLGGMRNYQYKLVSIYSCGLPVYVFSIFSISRTYNSCPAGNFIRKAKEVWGKSDTVIKGGLFKN